MIDLSGKTALVTGAASGIGYGMAKRLAECGANVALCDIESNVHNIANEISDVTSSKVKSAVVDVGKHPKFSHSLTIRSMDFVA